jgi:hypothetical protein
MRIVKAQEDADTDAGAGAAAGMNAGAGVGADAGAGGSRAASVASADAKSARAASPACELELAAWMANMEHGATVYAPDFTSGAGTPWPAIPIPAVTRRGLSRVAHYRAAVGVVFYSPDYSSADVSALARRLAAILEDRVGDAHLIGPGAIRAMDATAVSILRRRGDVKPGTVIDHLEETAAPVGVGAAPPPSAARRLNVKLPGKPHFLPSEVGIGAVFTWCFLPITAVISEIGTSLGRGASSSYWGGAHRSRLLNALVASIYYDVPLAGRAAFSPFRNGEEIFRYLECADFPPAALPAPLDWAALAAVRAMGGSLAPGSRMLTVDPESGKIGLGLALYAGVPRAHRAANARALAALPVLEWAQCEGGVAAAASAAAASATAPPAPPPRRCLCCQFPVAGEAVAFREARYRPDLIAAAHGVEAATQAATGCGELWAGAAVPRHHRAHQRYQLICAACWSCLASPSCAASHLGTAAYRTVAPTADIWRGYPGGETFAALCAGRARRTRAEGIYTVQLADGRFVALVGAHIFSKAPHISEPVLAQFGIPVISDLRIAEVVGQRAAAAAAY